MMPPWYYYVALFVGTALGTHLAGRQAMRGNGENIGCVLGLLLAGALFVFLAGFVLGRYF